MIALTVAAVVMPRSPSTGGEVDPKAPATVTTKSSRSTIVASIQDIQAGIPLLEQRGLSRQSDPIGLEYRWESEDRASWIRFYDAGSDGTLDRIAAVFATPQNDRSQQIVAAGLSLRLIQLASGTDCTVDAFNEWLSSVANGNAIQGQSRTFGSTPAHLQATLTANGQTGIRLTIGEERH
ncbi:MAG: hypothetical protein U1F29_10765 [Planctomycetota bacterium]